MIKTQSHKQTNTRGENIITSLTRVIINLMDITSGDVYPSYVRFVGPVHSIYSTYAYFVYLNIKFMFLASLWRENI